jgi:hypothetical protein
MSKPTKQFELLGSLVGHPVYKDANRGDVLKLEVGDDGLPTSDLLRSRVRPLGVEHTGEEMTEADAKGKAKEIVDKAKEKAKEIVEKAEKDAQAITDKANSDAAELIQAASQK